ncbi:MAG: hypothetical protein JSW10_04390 [Pseudomonadota bacterium]|nr:MAG: hypothetical protein JSW10_04390 [Pseudomonadota bacterium]
MSADEKTSELKMDPAALYREDVFTDRKLGTIRMMTPVTSAGEPDVARKVLYAGQAQLLTPVGTLPLSFEIDADSLADAIEKFAGAAQIAVDQTMKELQEMRREAASSIVVPGTGMGGPGGLPGGGGKIQMP